jgi:predicted AAA+ superfamily ATPase
MIIRKITPKIMENMQYFPATGITDPRQVGKTTLAKNLADESKWRNELY